MEKKLEIKRQNNLRNNYRSKYGLEIQNYKIIPQLYKFNIKEDSIRDNEWDQEYYIIYNSYALEEKDS